MSLKSVRAAAQTGSAVAVLDAGLSQILWMNAAGRRLLGLAEAPDADAMRQIRSAREAFAGKGRTQLLLRPPEASGLGKALLARLEAISAGRTHLALLTVKLGTDAAAAPDEQAREFLHDAGLAEALACVVGPTGLLAATNRLPEDEHSLLAIQGQEFLQADEDRLVVEDEAGALSFTRVGDGLVLIHIDMPSVAEEPVAEPAAVEDAGPAAAPAGEASIEAEIEIAEPAAPDAAAEPVDEVAPVLVEPEESISNEMAGLPDEMPEPAPAALSAEPFRAVLDAEPVRFVWQTDAETCFSQLSPEFAAIVGPRAADVIGRPFADVARVFGFDETGEIERLLQRRDTWSGRTILWPIEGTDRRAPIDLAGLPLYSRDREFLGFRGFGVVRPAEHESDPAAIGLALALPERSARIEVSAASLPAGDDAAEAQAAAAFGRRTAPPVMGVETVAERRRREANLSNAEVAAFKAIGAKLGLRAHEALADAQAPLPAPVETAASDAAPDDGSTLLLPVQELEDMLDALPLAVLVQMQERLIFANRRFFTLTRYEDLDALEAAGGLDHLVQTSGSGFDDETALIQCADGSFERARLHLQRISVAGRSCLLMSFPPAEAEPEEDMTPILLDLQGEVEELQAVLDTATDGILLLDEGERLRKMNGAAEALFGLRPESYVGLPLQELLAPDSRRVLTDYIGTLRDNGLAAILNDGREVEARVAGGDRTIPLFVTLGRLSQGRGWCVVIRDIAQWKSAESDLIEARRLAEDASLHKSRFLANISHELRTPLNAIIGFADVMASECFGPIGHERYLEYLGDIKRSGHHVLDLVNDLLDISKIEAGKVDLAFEAVSLNEVVAEVVSLMQPQANRERVIVRSVLPASVPSVVADRRSVRQIALNLIANAVRFTPAGGQIVASTHYGAAGEVALRFRDSGIGMTEREIEIALTPFQQVNAGRNERGEGTGLGLPLTKAMAEANRAQFSIASTPGEGTLVEIVFPAQRVLAD
ncbi:PAS domain-containing protein [Aureimonas phyllosphaerae]|uniref:histidine kinase n=1 Tax=Aureimonas phyllosphaerae TaxID=1166078 RepID=A0A7W6FVV2_9HYPH|nr:PAS domain-containing protein [Aureimonas phyllosphaerae]MBB3936437.1 PAS domain S-box-containing protein [Aureimonas phyllosphaerae]MBB3960699.1 PAS domain S-box-containing protein [Aureimonas phyllosphaerae]SFF30258.1 PAS/PAC sensor signal transduction histidine kinase [Aureimonas phyllosphaerae]